MDLNGTHASMEPEPVSSWQQPGAQGWAGSSPQRTATLESWQARVRRYNSDIDPTSDRFRTAVLLLAALDVGQNIDVLARKTSYSRAFVAKVARRLIDNGVWSGGKTISEWAPADEASGVAFWNDVAVAEGRLCRRTVENGAIEWAPPGYWNKSYDYTKAGDGLSAEYHDPKAPVAETSIPGTDITAAVPVNGVASPPTPKKTAESPPQTPPKTPATLDEIFADAVWIR
jgi:hypothetical protein